MKTLGLCVALVVLAYIQSGTSQSSDNFLYDGDDCQAVQAFERGRKYYYNYEATIEHFGVFANGSKLGISARCSRIIISVLSSCAASMKVHGCVLYQAQQQKDGSVTFDDVVPKSSKFAHTLHRFTTYFYFNQGQITKVFLHMNEPTEVGNLKKAILSALSYKFSGEGSSASIFGDGNMYSTVTARHGENLNVTTQRYLNEERHRSSYENPMFSLSGAYDYQDSDLFRFFKKEIHAVLLNYFGSSSPTPTCKYYLKRGRIVAAVTCSEMHTTSFSLAVILGSLLYESRNFMGTNVTLRMSMYRNSSLRYQDRLTKSQADLLKNRYQNQSLTFRTYLDQDSATSQSSFRPVDAFLHLINGPADEGALVFAKLVLWAQGQNEEAVTNVWYSILTSLASSPEQMPKAMGIWLQLMSDCMDSKWCYSKTDCSNTVGCQGAFSSLLSSRSMAGGNKDAELVLLDVLSSIKLPSSPIVQTALHLATSNPSSATVLTLGKVLNRYAKTSNPSNKTIADGIEIFRATIDEKCILTQNDKETEKTVEYAIKSGSSFLTRDSNVLQSIIHCMQHRRASLSVVRAATQVMNNKGIAGLPQVRRTLFSILRDQKQLTESRLAGFLILVNHDPNNEEIDQIITLAYDTSEDASMTYYMIQYIKSQLMLSGTEYSSFTPRTVEKILAALALQKRIKSPSEFQAKTTKRVFSYGKAINLSPEKHVDINTIISLYFVDKNLAPFMIEFSIQATMENHNISLLDMKVDVGTISVILESMSGIDGILPNDMIQYILNLPLYNWMGSIDIQPPPLPESSLKNLDLITSKFRLAQSILEMQKKSFVEIKLYGKKMSFGSFFQTSLMKEITLTKIIKFAENLESGIQFNHTMLNMLGHFKSQVPTSVGIALETNVDIASLVNPAVRAVVEISKLYFTGRGSANLHTNLIAHLQMSVMRTMKFPRAPPCGSGIMFDIAHNGGGQIETTKTIQSIETILHNNKKNSLISLRIEALSTGFSSPTGLEVSTSSRDLQCPRMLSSPTFPWMIYVTNCGTVVPRENGIWIGSIEFPLQMKISWGKMTANKNGATTPAFGIELVAKEKTQHSDVFQPRVVFTTKYLPMFKEIQISEVFRNNLEWVAAANFITTINPDSSDLSKVFTSFNVTGSDGTSSVISTLLIEKAEKDTPLNELLAEYGLQGIFNYGSDVGYNIDGNVFLPTIGMQLVVLGHIPMPTPNGEYTTVAKVCIGSTCKPPLFKIAYEKKYVAEDGKTQSRVGIAVKDFNQQILPIENVSLGLTWYNDTSGYKKILRFESMITDSSPGPFFDLRHSTTFRSSNRVPTNYDWNATITAPIFQCQFSTDAKDEKTFTIISHLVIPSNRISLASVKHTSHELIRLPMAESGNKVFGIEVALGAEPEGHMNKTIFYAVNGIKKYLFHVSRNQVGCDHCLAVEIKTLVSEGRLEFYLQPNILRNSLYLSVPPSLARGFGVSSTVIPLGEPNRINLGYNLAVEIFPTNVTLEADVFQGNYKCSMNGDMKWNKEIIEENPSYSTDIGAVCRQEVTNERSAVDVNIRVASAYDVRTVENNVLRKFNISRYAQKSELMKFNDTIEVGATSLDNLLENMAFSRSTTYSLAESETNEAVENKTAVTSGNATYLRLTDHPWSSPTYHIDARGRIPALEISPGGGYMTFQHSGDYMLGEHKNADELLDEACESMAKCKQRYKSVMQKNNKNSLSALMRLMKFAFTEHQSFADVPWKQLAHMMTSFSYVEISPYHIDPTVMKNASHLIFNQIRNRLMNLNHNLEGNLSHSTEMESALLKMQGYLSSLAGMKNEEDYSLDVAKVYIESLFRGIYEIDFALGSILENPLVLPKFVTPLGNYIISTFSPFSRLASAERNQAMGFFYPDATQLVTMNNHFHILPRTANRNCNWLEVEEINEKLVTVALKHSGTLISFNNAVLFVYRNGSFSMIGENNQAIPLEFPFSSSGYFCSKLTDHVVECKNPFESLRYIFDPQKDEIVGYADVLVFQLKMVNGVLGKSIRDSVVLPRALPDGINGVDEAEFFNSYLLTDDATCKFTPQNFSRFHSTSNGLLLCTQAFSKFPFATWGISESDFDALLEACSQRSTTKQHTCKYTDVLVHSLRSKGIPAKRDPDCLHCGISQPVVSTLNKVNLMLVVSRSIDSLSLNPKTTLSTIVQKSFEELHAKSISDVYVTLVTYGGPLQFYLPAKNTIKNSVSSSNAEDIENAISNLEFNGPSYDSLSTIEAMRFAAINFDDAYKGIINSVVIVAPETLHQNIAGTVPLCLVNKFNHELANLFLVSSMNKEECTASHVTTPSRTSGDCFTSTGLNELVEAIGKTVEEKINHSVSCRCEEIASVSGSIDSQCHLI